MSEFFEEIYLAKINLERIQEDAQLKEQYKYSLDESLGIFQSKIEKGKILKKWAETENKNLVPDIYSCFFYKKIQRTVWFYLAGFRYAFDL